MQHELFEQGKQIVAYAAGTEPARRMIGHMVHRHGLVESRVLERICTIHPEYLESIPLWQALFGALLHDIGKIRSVPEPRIWLTRTTLFTPDDHRATAEHLDEGVKIMQEAQFLGYYVPPIAFSIVEFHHELLNGKGLKKIDAKTLPKITRVMVVVDNLVAWSEDRSFRYGVPQKSFQEAWHYMVQQEAGRYDMDVMQDVWEMYSPLTQSLTKGLGWVFE